MDLSNYLSVYYKSHFHIEHDGWMDGSNKRTIEITVNANIANLRYVSFSNYDIRRYCREANLALSVSWSQLQYAILCFESIKCKSFWHNSLKWHLFSAINFLCDKVSKELLEKKKKSACINLLHKFKHLKITKLGEELTCYLFSNL